jgi:hypothetical protein
VIQELDAASSASGVDARYTWRQRRSAGILPGDRDHGRGGSHHHRGTYAMRCDALAGRGSAPTRDRRGHRGRGVLTPTSVAGCQCGSSSRTSMYAIRAPSADRMLVRMLGRDGNRGLLGDFNEWAPIRPALRRLNAVLGRSPPCAASVAAPALPRPDLGAAATALVRLRTIPAGSLLGVGPSSCSAKCRCGSDGARRQVARWAVNRVLCRRRLAPQRELRDLDG